MAKQLSLKIVAFHLFDKEWLSHLCCIDVLLTSTCRRSGKMLGCDKRKIKAQKAVGTTGCRLGPGFTFRLICLAV